MDPIRGTNVSLDITLSSLKAAEVRSSIETAGIKLAIDAQKITGQGIVEMIENLGKNIDTYV